MATTEKILIIRHGAFGDLVQAEGALHDIRTFHADAEIVLLTTPPFRKLMERCPHIDRILLDERAPFWKMGKALALRRTLLTEQFTHVYDLQSSPRTAHYQRWMKSGSVRVWSRNNNRASATTPDREAYAAQLAAAMVPVHHAACPDASWMAEDMTPLLVAEGIMPGYIVLIPGSAAKHPQKRWPYYAELAKELMTHGYQIVTAPGPDELELAKTIPGFALLGSKGFLNWFELAGVLQKAAFVVGNDTGPSHIASCLSRPGLVLFGSHTTAQRTGILRKDFHAIEVADLKELPVQQVLDAMLPRLAKP